MSCERYLDLISVRLDGELTAPEQAELDAHLQACPACRAIANDLEGLHSVLTEPGEVDAPAELSAGVLAKIKVEKQHTSRRFVRRLAGMAACLLLCVGALRIADATDSEANRPAADPHLPGVARHVADEFEFKALPFSIDAYSLSQTVIDFAPVARLLDSTDGLERFLARFPNDDLSLAKNTYDEGFFLTNRLLAVVIQEPSSSVTHAISELTEDSVTILRDTTATGGNDRPRWLMLIPTELNGPERDLTVKLTDF